MIDSCWLIDWFSSNNNWAGIFWHSWGKYAPTNRIIQTPRTHVWWGWSGQTENALSSHPECIHKAHSFVNLEDGKWSFRSAIVLSKKTPLSRTKRLVFSWKEMSCFINKHSPWLIPCLSQGQYVRVSKNPANLNLLFISTSVLLYPRLCCLFRARQLILLLSVLLYVSGNTQTNVYNIFCCRLYFFFSFLFLYLLHLWKQTADGVKKPFDFDITFVSQYHDLLHHTDMPQFLRCTEERLQSARCKMSCSDAKQLYRVLLLGVEVWEWQRVEKTNSPSVACAWQLLL